MTTSSRAYADLGLRRARMLSAGRFTPPTHRSYSEASSWVAGVPIVGKLFSSSPGADDGLVDKLTTAITGTAFDPATRLGMPPSTPSDWAAQPDGDTKYAFYTEGVNAGFVRGTLFGAVVGAGVTALTHVLLMRWKGKR